MESWLATERHFTDYLLTQRKAPHTVRTYVSNLRTFWGWCAKYEIPPGDATRSLIREWIGERLQQASAQRVSNDLAALKHFYSWLMDERLRDDNPVLGLSVKRPKLLPTKPLQDTDAAALYAACTNERDRLIILMLIATGLRISEMASLTAEMIDWRDGVIRIVGKGSKQREIKPERAVLQRLRAYLGMFPTGPVWISSLRKLPLSDHQLRKIVYEIAVRAGLSHVHPHRFRSTFATAYIDHHGDIQALQGMMGHESIETTARYSEYTKIKRGQEQMSNLDFVRRLMAAG